MVAQRRAGVLGRGTGRACCRIGTTWSTNSSNPPGSAGRHDVEAVGGAALEPGLDLVGDLLRRAGDRPGGRGRRRAGAAAGGSSGCLAVDDSTTSLKRLWRRLERCRRRAAPRAAARRARSRDEIDAEHLARAGQRVLGLDQLVELVLQRGRASASVRADERADARQDLDLVGVPADAAVARALMSA